MRNISHHNGVQLINLLMLAIPCKIAHYLAMVETLRPLIHFDFDGTIVQTAPKYSLRNFRKYPLVPMQGFQDFFSGLHVEDGEGNPLIEIGRIISRRPNINQRRRVTSRSLLDCQLNGEFYDGYVCLEGSEEDKAKRVIEDSATIDKEKPGRVVGMIEDKPHKLGLEIVQHVLGNGEVHEPIVIGVVNHPEAGSRIEILEKTVVAQFGGKITVDHENDGIQFISHENGSFSLDVIQLGDYSEIAGSSFANRLLDYTF